MPRIYVGQCISEDVDVFARMNLLIVEVDERIQESLRDKLKGDILVRFKFIMRNYVASKAYFSANNEKCPNYTIAKKITNIFARDFSRSN